MLTDLTAPQSFVHSTDKTINILAILVNAQKSDQRKLDYFSGLIKKYPLETIKALITALTADHPITLIQQMRSEVEKAEKAKKPEISISLFGNRYSRVVEQLEGAQAEKKQQEEAVSSPTSWLLIEGTPPSPVSQHLRRRESSCSSGAHTSLAASEELFIDEYKSLASLSNVIKDFKTNMQSLLKCFGELVSHKDESAKMIQAAMGNLALGTEAQQFQALSKVIEFFTSPHAQDIAATLGKSLVSLDASVSERGEHSFFAIADTAELLENLLTVIMSWDNEAVKTPQSRHVESIVNKMKEFLLSAPISRKRFSL